MSYRFGGLVSALLCTGLAARATTLVALWSPGHVLLAADSAVITNIGPFSTVGSGCKIGSQSGTWFAFSGLVDDQSHGFNAAAVAQKAARAGGSVEEQANRFIAAVRQPLGAALAGLQKDDPDQFGYLEQGHPALQAIFVGTDEGQPSLVVAQANVGPDGQVSDLVRVIARGDDGRGPRVIYAGQQRNIRQWLDGHPDWYEQDHAALVQRLVQLEIDSSKGMVGGPVDVLELGPNGPHWIRQKSGCEQQSATVWSAPAYGLRYPKPSGSL